MMNKIVFILLLLASNLTIAQNFSPISAKWHFQNFCQTPAYINNCGFFAIESIRDTTINGNLCTVLEKDTGFIVANAQLIIWENNSRVYFYENNQFKLLFDFNLNAGDTLIYHIPENYSHYNLVCSTSIPDTSKTERAIIDSTKHVIINFQSLKRLYTSPLIFNDTNYLQWNLGQITERIGSSYGMLGQPQLQCTGGFSGHFRCYSDSLISYKPVAEDCDYVTSINNYLNNNSMNIYPNPTSSNFTINRINTSYNLIIYNSVGQILYSKNNVKGKREIDATNFPKGMLLIRIETESAVYYQKIVKE